MVASRNRLLGGQHFPPKRKRFPETAKSKKNGGRRINAGLSRLIMNKLTDLEYLRLNTFQRLWYNIVLFVLGIPGWPLWSKPSETGSQALSGASETS